MPPVGCESINVYLYRVRMSRYQWPSAPIGIMICGARGGGLYRVCLLLGLVKNFAVCDGFCCAWRAKYVVVKCRFV